MDQFILNAYTLKKYNDCEGYKSAKLSLTNNFPDMGRSISLGSISLDEEDILYLYNKYKISELKQKEVEESILFRKLNEIRENIKYLKSIKIK